jgi:hypothetical protein
MRITVGARRGDIVGDTNLALQAGVDYLSARGGGTLEIGPGRYAMKDSLHLASNVRVVGAGARTVLVKCPGSESRLRIDADWGQLKLTPRSLRGFEVGMGVTVGDEAHPGWHVTTARIVEVRGGSLYVDTHLVGNYTTEKRGWVRNAVPVISGVEVEDASVENLVVDGNRRENPKINGCRGAGIYLLKARRCTLADCRVRRFNGDGISFQVDEDCIIDSCTVERVAGLGLHPGTGSARPVVMNCTLRNNGLDGLFLCWRVQDGVFEGCTVEGNGRYGISIGHKDTDNLFRGNLVRGNGSDGIHFRAEKRGNAGSRNRFERNRIEANGRKTDAAGVGIHPATEGLEFVGNVIRPGRFPSGRRGQRAAFRLWNGAGRPSLRGNRVARHPEGQVQRSGGVTPRE